MLTLSSPIRPFTSSLAFSSPLMPRSTNIQTSPKHQPTPKFTHSSPISAPTWTSESSAEVSTFAFTHIRPSQRRTDPRIPERRLVSRNPLVASANVRQQRRREQYLAQVREKRDEGRWAARSDQILWSDWLESQRQWETAQANEAPDASENVDREYDGIHGSQEHIYTSWQTGRWNPSSQLQQQEANSGTVKTISRAFNTDQQEVEAMAQAENEEMEALVAMHEQGQTSSPLYGSDDEDLEEAFAELADPDGQRAGSMDMS